MPDLSPQKLSGLAYSGIGVSFAASVGIFAWLGHWADGHFGTKPWLLIVGIFIGLISATCELLRQIRKLDRSQRES